MQLIELVKQAEVEGQNLWPELDRIINNYDWSKKPEAQNWARNDLYVRNLGGLVKVLKTKRVCEIGTQYGNSSIGLSLGCSKVDAYDINMNNFVCPQIAKDRNISLITLKDDRDFLNIYYPSYDFIFCDIGEHTGVEEQLFHEKLLELNYNGIVAYDDIVGWGSLHKFWDSIKLEKAEPKWHDKAGFGLVRYGENV